MVPDTSRASPPTPATTLSPHPSLADALRCLLNSPLSCRQSHLLPWTLKMPDPCFPLPYGPMTVTQNGPTGCERQCPLGFGGQISSQGTSVGIRLTHDSIFANGHVRMRCLELPLPLGELEGRHCSHTEGCRWERGNSLVLCNYGWSDSGTIYL